MIKFFNVHLQYQQDREAYLDLADRVYSSGQVINGEYCRKLENSLKFRTGRKYCVLTASCTDALAFVGEHCVSENSTTIFPDISFPATSAGFVRGHDHRKHTVKYAGVDHNGLIDLNHLEELVAQPGDKTVVWANLFGHVIDHDALLDIQAKNPHVIFVEDAAQSFGATWGYTASGAMGIASCFSFDPTKNLSAFGLGGAVLTDSAELAEAVDLHRRPHTARWINHGHNSQINEVDAAVVWWKLENRFDSWQQRRTDIANYYISELSDVVDMVLPKQNCTSAWHKFVIKTQNRSGVQSSLKEHGVDTKIHYPRTLSNRETEFTRSCLSLPIYPELTDSEVEHIASSTVTAVKLFS